MQRRNRRSFCASSQLGVVGLATVVLAGCASTGDRPLADVKRSIHETFSGIAEGGAQWGMGAPEWDEAVDATAAPVLRIQGERQADQGLRPVQWPRDFRGVADAATPVALGVPRSRHQPDAGRQTTRESEPSTNPTPAAVPAKPVDAPVVTVEPRQEPIVTPPEAPTPTDIAPKPKAERAQVLVPIKPKVAFVASAEAEANPAKTIARAKALRKAGQLAAARQLLSAGPLAQNPEALLVLGEMYDPLMLGNSPVLHGAANVDVAIELYQSAVAKGNMDAIKRLAALQASRKP